MLQMNPPCLSLGWLGMLAEGATGAPDKPKVLPVGGRCPGASVENGLSDMCGWDLRLGWVSVTSPPTSGVSSSRGVQSPLHSVGVTGWESPPEPPRGPWRGCRDFARTAVNVDEPWPALRSGGKAIVLGEFAQSVNRQLEELRSLLRAGEPGVAHYSRRRQVLARCLEVATDATHKLRL